MAISLKLLGPDDAAVLEQVAPEVFDGPVQRRLAEEFLADRRHHIIVALDDDTVVGMITALDYVHPDKQSQLFVNELGVAPGHRRRGIGTRLLAAMLAHGRTLGCTEAWVGTEVENREAVGLYAKAGGRAESFVLFEFPVRPIGA